MNLKSEELHWEGYGIIVTSYLLEPKFNVMKLCGMGWTKVIWNLFLFRPLSGNLVEPNKPQKYENIYKKGKSKSIKFLLIKKSKHFIMIGLN